MKKLFKKIILTFMAVIMCFSMVGCDGGSGGGGGGVHIPGTGDMLRDNDFKEDTNRRPDRGPYIDNTPLDDGVLTDNVFQFENAKFTGPTKGQNHRCVGKGFEFNTMFGGNICTKENDASGSFTFDFTSTKAVRSTLTINLALNVKAATLAELLVISNNGNPVVDTSVAVPAEGIAPPGTSTYYFTMVTVETKISLALGKNKLVFKSAGGTCPNLDSFNIKTSAVIEDLTVNSLPVPSTFTEISKIPTETAKGQIKFACREEKCTNSATKELPILTDKVYDVQEIATGDIYSIKIFDTLVTVANFTTYELTLQGAKFEDETTTAKLREGAKPNLIFTTEEGYIFKGWKNVNELTETFPTVFVMPAKDITIAPIFEKKVKRLLKLEGATLDDGTTTEKEFDALDVITLQCSVPTGKVLTGWYNVDDKSEYFEPATIEDLFKFTMPDKAITIAPMFDVEATAYAPKPGTGAESGKIQLYPKNGLGIPGGGAPSAPGYFMKLPDGGTFTKDPYWGVVDNKVGLANAKEAGNERGAVYCFKGDDADPLTENDLFPAKWHCTAVTPYKVVATTSYTITYTIENQGTETIKLRLYQTNKSATPKPVETSTAEFELQVGEVKELTITFTGFGNNNIMTTIEVIDQIESFQIGLLEYVVATPKA